MDYEKDFKYYRLRYRVPFLDCNRSSPSDVSVADEELSFMPAF